MNARNSRKCSTPRSYNTTRQGVAAAEFAVCLPVLVLLVLAMIESCTMIFLKQSLTVTAYEGVRIALKERAVAADVQKTCQQIFVDRRVQGGTVTINPPNFETLPSGAYIEVTVSALADLNSVIPGSFFNGKTLTATATMMKEF
jgi:Flp pilus assembly protein TadG